MNIGNLGKIKTWALLELLNFIFMILTGVLLALWVKQYTDNDYYLSGYFPLFSALIWLINSFLKSPMEQRMERVSLWIKTKKARRKANIPNNEKVLFKWSKTMNITFILMILSMVITILCIDLIIIETDEIAGLISILEVVGWFSVGLSVMTGMFGLLFLAPSINHPSWMKVKILETLD